MCSALPVRAVTVRINANAADMGAAAEAQQHDEGLAGPQ